jgi:hypothetical protein
MDRDVAEQETSDDSEASFSDIDQEEGETAEHYAQTLLDDIKGQVADSHTREELAPTKKIKKERPIDGASITELELTFKCFFHAAIEAQSRWHETIPTTNDVQNMKTDLKRLNMSILRKLRATTPEDVPHEALIQEMLDDSMHGCAWTYVVTTTREMEERALPRSHHYACACRKARQYLQFLLVD